MALSNRASDTAVSATSPSDINLSSAFSMLAIQDPSIPTPGKCYIEKCAVEILIQFPEAAQDVLYRFVDLRPAEKDLEEEYRRNDRPTKSGLAVFLWTIERKPHLAAKVRDLWFLPSRESVAYLQLGYSGVSLVSPRINYSDGVTEVRETQLACDLLARLTDLRSLTITALDDYLCCTQLGDPDGHESLKAKGPHTVFGRLPIGLEKLIGLPCFSKLTFIYLSHGRLDWAILTLPTLHTLCVGSEMTLQLPSKLSQAPNITSLILEAVQEELGDKPGRAIRLLAHFPNVNALTLGSCTPNGQNSRFPQHRDRRHSGILGNLGAFSPGLIREFLTVGRSIENLTFTYTTPVRFRDTTSIRLDIKAFEQVRRLQTAECAVVDSHNFQRLAGSNPSELLPRRIRTLVITHPRSPGQDDGDRKSKLTSWLGELTKTDFPDLERVEVVCSVGYGDDVGFKQRLEQSEEVQDLKTVGVAVVVRKE